MSTPNDGLPKQAPSFHENAHGFSRVIRWLWNIPREVELRDASPLIIAGWIEWEANTTPPHVVQGLTSAPLPVGAEATFEPPQSAYPAPLRVPNKPTQQRQGAQAPNTASAAQTAAGATTHALSEQLAVELQQMLEMPASAAGAAQSRRQKDKETR